MQSNNNNMFKNKHQITKNICIVIIRIQAFNIKMIKIIILILLENINKILTQIITRIIIMLNLIKNNIIFNLTNSNTIMRTLIIKIKLMIPKQYLNFINKITRLTIFKIKNNKISLNLNFIKKTKIFNIPTKCMYLNKKFKKLINKIRLNLNSNHTKK